MINYATVGTSWITESFINGCDLLGDKFHLAAVYSRDKAKGEAFAAKFGCATVYTSLEELAKDNSIQAVYIASPNALHFSQSKLMLENGKHCICEKPITVTPSQLKELQTLAKQNNVIYMEAIMGPNLPAWNAVVNALQKIGKISHARFDFSQRSSKYDAMQRGIHQNIFDPKMATGALMDLGVYCVYPALGWFGQPESVYAYCNKVRTGADGDGGAVLKYNGFTAELCWSKVGQSHLGSEIIGDNGTLVIPSISKLINIKYISNDGTEEAICGDMDKPQLMSCEANSFYQYITDFPSHAKRYEQLIKLALEVSRLMQTIRTQSGITF